MGNRLITHCMPLLLRCCWTPYRVAKCNNALIEQAKLHHMHCVWPASWLLFFLTRTMLSLLQPRVKSEQGSEFRSRAQVFRLMITGELMANGPQSDIPSLSSNNEWETKSTIHVLCKTTFVHFSSTGVVMMDQQLVQLKTNHFKWTFCVC